MPKYNPRTHITSFWSLAVNRMNWMWFWVNCSCFNPKTQRTTVYKTTVNWGSTSPIHSYFAFRPSAIDRHEESRRWRKSEQEIMCVCVWERERETEIHCICLRYISCNSIVIAASIRIHFLFIRISCLKPKSKGKTVFGNSIELLFYSAYNGDIITDYKHKFVCAFIRIDEYARKCVERDLESGICWTILFYSRHPLAHFLSHLLSYPSTPSLSLSIALCIRLSIWFLNSCAIQSGRNKFVDLDWT